MKISVETVFDGALTVRKSDQRNMLKAEWITAGETWHERHRPHHFSHEAYARYPDAYIRRKRSYNERKRRKLGHDRPLVKSGEVERESKTVTRMTATINQVHIVMPVRKLNFKPKGTSINMLNEFRAVNDNEYRQYERSITRGIEHRIATYKRPERKRSS